MALLYDNSRRRRRVPELPEVETTCRLMRRLLVGRRIVSAVVKTDDIVLKGLPADVVRQALEGATVERVGRKGKYWWWELDRRPWAFGHLGMTGHVFDLATGDTDKRVHGLKQGLVDGEPRFLKVLVEMDDGGRLAFTDGRRLARFWLGESPETDRAISALGYDVHEELPAVGVLHEKLVRRKAPLKNLLMDQSLFAGVGNYLADETMYQARLSPHRLGSSLSLPETRRLHKALKAVVTHAVDVGADYERFPQEWLFHHRWGGDRGPETIGGRAIQRDPIGGRTTAWVPSIQK